MLKPGAIGQLAWFNTNNLQTYINNLRVLQSVINQRQGHSLGLYGPQILTRVLTRAGWRKAYNAFLQLVDVWHMRTKKPAIAGRLVDSRLVALSAQ